MYKVNHIFTVKHLYGHSLTLFECFVICLISSITI